MKNIKTIILILILTVSLSVNAFAQQNRISKGEIDVVATGTVESFLAPQLHRAMPESDENAQQLLDLSLKGPDEKSRAFEIFWREASQEGLIPIKGASIKLKDDKRLLWEAELPKDLLTSAIQVRLPFYKNTARLKFDVNINGQWQELENDIAVMRQTPGSPHGFAEITFEEKKITGLRIHFSGFDQNFDQVPVDSVEVWVSSRKDAIGFKHSSFAVEFEETEFEKHKELQIKLPGSGIFIEQLQIETSGLFQGSYKLGYEKILLGKREFYPVVSGIIAGIDNDPNKLTIDCNRVWQTRTMILQLEAEEYYGKSISVNAFCRLPRIAFVADMVGRYEFTTGLNKPSQVKEYALTTKRQVAIKEKFQNIVHNHEHKAEDILKNIAIAGGPFNPEGYAWKAKIKLEAPGFYKLEPDFNAMNSSYVESFRIVKDDYQIPFFPGRHKLKEFPADFKQTFDANRNESIYYIRVPTGSSLPLTLKLEAAGVFDRTILLKKHVAGHVGWQNWKTITWQNTRNAAAELRINLVDFPKDQPELKLIIQNKNNQSLKIDSIKLVYPALDLYFVAREAGLYYLFGGRQSRQPPKYDLAMVQHRLFELFPENVAHDELQIIATRTQSIAGGHAKGGPFEPAGYTWVATFTVSAPGLTQVILNKQAALDDFNQSIRIVKNGFQVPYFKGQSYQRKMKLELEPVYDKSKNMTSIDISLPQASKSWQSIEFSIPGVFERKPVMFLRKPGKLGWKKWKELHWRGTQQGLNTFSTSLAGLPYKETDLRLEIDHKDNSPLVFGDCYLIFKQHDLFFNASMAGEYQLFGGNSDAAVPDYDIKLIRDQMLKKEPQKVYVKEAIPFSEIAIGNQLKEAFSEKGWGLYFVLGLVTIILVVLIVKIFPEASSDHADQHDQSDKNI